MYALHPGSLPPKSAKATERTQVDASDLIALYGVPAEECIVWNPADGYDWFDFIHLYPSYYERYTLKSNGAPEKDVPDVPYACPGSSNPLSTRRNTAKPSRAHHRG
jgi:hypothetical protein